MWGSDNPARGTWREPGPFDLRQRILRTPSFWDELLAAPDDEARRQIVAAFIPKPAGELEVTYRGDIVSIVFLGSYGLAGIKRMLLHRLGEHLEVTQFI